MPRAAFTWVTQRLKSAVNIPLITSNRINTPAMAEHVLAEGHADVVSMARPFLADPQFLLKAEQNRSDEINTCIGCNQACLDHIFSGKLTSCLVNQGLYENEPGHDAVEQAKNIAVLVQVLQVLAFALHAAERGHLVTLFEASPQIGGQFNIAKSFRAKKMFYETFVF